MAYINLRTSANSVFKGASTNDVQFYTKTPGNTFYIGASNSSNALIISPSGTTACNATMSNLVITGAIWSSNTVTGALTMYSAGGGGGGGSTSLPTDPTVNSVTTNTSTTSILNVLSEIIVTGGADVTSYVSPTVGTFSSIMASNITAYTSLSVLGTGTVAFPTGSVDAATLKNSSTATLSNLILTDGLTIQSKKITLLSNAIPFTAIDSNTVTVPWSSIRGTQAGQIVNADMSSSFFANSNIPSTAIDFTSTTSNIPVNAVKFSTLNAIPWSSINSNQIPIMASSTANLTYTPCSVPLWSLNSNNTLSNNTNVIPWSAIDSNTLPLTNTNTNINSMVTNTAAVGSLLTVGGEIVISNSPADQIYTSGTNTYGLSSTSSNMSLSNLTVASNITMPLGAFIGFNTTTPQYEIDAPTGSIRAQHVYNVSDLRTKTYITPITSESASLTSLKQLNPVFYEFIDKPGKRHAGLIAQEVEQVFPDAVDTTTDFVPVPASTELKEGDVVKFDNTFVTTVTGPAAFDPPAPENGVLTHKQVVDFKVIDYAALMAYVIASLKP